MAGAAFCLLALILWSCNTDPQDENILTLKLDSARVGKFDSVLVEIYNGKAPGAGDTAKPVQSKTIKVGPTTKEISVKLDGKVNPDFTVVVTGYRADQIAYRNLHTVDAFTTPDENKPAVLLISRILAEDLTLNVGETRLPVLSFEPSDPGDKRISLLALDSEFVAVVGDSLKGLAEGNARVQASTADGKVKVTFTAHITAVRVTELMADTLQLKVGDTLAPAVTVVPGNATDKEYSLESLSPDLFGVAGNAVIGLKPGQGKLVLASHDGGAKDTMIVRVRIPVTGISGKDLTHEVGDRFVPVLEFQPGDATRRGYSLTSADTTKVSVVGDRDSLAANAIGSAKITVRANDGGFTAEFTVEVVRKVFHVQTAVCENLRGLAGDTLVPKVAWTPSNATEQGFTLASDDTAVASVSGERIIARKIGKANLTLTTVDGGKVAEFLVSVELSDFNQDIKPITSSKCAPCHVPPPNVTFNWTDSAQLARKGVIAMNRLTRPDTALGHMPLPGATGGPLTKRELAILMEWLARVSVPLGSVSVADSICNFGDTVTPVILFSPANATNKVFTLVSSDTAVVAVRGGSLLPLDMGKVTIDVVTDEGPRAKFSLTVNPPAFDKNVKPITKLKCAPCHLTGATFNWQDSTALIADGVEAIRRLTLPDTATGRMPLSLPDNPPPNGELSPQQLKVLLAWLHTKVVPLQGISVANDSLQLESSKEPSIIWDPPNATNKFFTLTSGDTAKVGILGTEMVGKSVGTATVVVTAADGGYSKAISVKVMPIPVDSIQVRDTGCVKDEKVYVKAIFFPANAGNQSFTLASVSLGGTKVKIDSGIKVTALALGKDTLEATTADGGKKKRFVFNVGPVPPKKLVVPDTNGLVSGSSLSPIVIPRFIWTPSTTTDKRVTLAITGDTANIAAVRNDSTLQPKTTLGKVTVTATSVADTSVKAAFSFSVGPVRVAGLTVTAVPASHVKDTLVPGILWNPTNATNKNFTLSLLAADTSKFSVVGTRLAVKKTGAATVTVTSQDSGNPAASWQVTAIKTPFKTNLLNIMTNRCGSCHNSATEASGQPNWQDSSRVVQYSAQIQTRLDIPYNAASLSNGHMPYGSVMRADTIAIIKAWLNQ